MIRQLAPILLIPAAWVLTLFTVTGSLTSYWIEHMHYFISIFLAGFLITSSEMLQDDVLKIWYGVIAGGLISILLGAGAFLGAVGTWGGQVSFWYWMIAPGLALVLSARKMTRFSSSYWVLGVSSLVASVLATAGLYTSMSWLFWLGVVHVAAIQTVSMVQAAVLDGRISEDMIPFL